jgi:hypothetical protein
VPANQAKLVEENGLEIDAQVLDGGERPFSWYAKPQETLGIRYEFVDASLFKAENDRVAHGGRLAEPLRAVTRAEQEGGTSRSGSMGAHVRSSPPRLTRWAAMTLRWISLVPSPTIIKGASRR